jgi:hypothetical protein
MKVTNLFQLRRSNKPKLIEKKKLLSYLLAGKFSESNQF